jgi:ABC-2 type transport system ATP-binding protein
MNVIETDNLTKRYGHRVGIEDLSITIEEGSLYGFLGPNGSGKTTTIRLLLGFLKPSSGSAQILNSNAWRDSNRIKKEVGYLPGDLRLYPWLTLKKSARMIGLIRQDNLTDAFDELAEKFLLDPTVSVREMSKGMRQKLGLIIALAHRPKLLILDEPTTALDPLIQTILYDHLRSLAHDGHTIFFSSHTLSEVEHLCDNVAILREGKLIIQERMQQFRQRSHCVVTIQWGSESDAEQTVPPDCLQIRQRNGCQWIAVLCGPTMDLVRWSATQPIEDLSFNTSDLNQVFQDIYSNVE